MKFGIRSVKWKQQKNRKLEETAAKRLDKVQRKLNKNRQNVSYVDSIYSMISRMCGENNEPEIRNGQEIISEPEQEITTEVESNQ